MTELYRPKMYQGWTRAYHVHMRNIRDQIPEMEFMEEEIIGTLSNKIGSFKAEFNLEKKYMRRSSVTGELTGETMTQADFLEWIYSIYMQEAEERDVKVAEAAIPVEEPAVEPEPELLIIPEV